MSVFETFERAPRIGMTAFISLALTLALCVGAIEPAAAASKSKSMASSRSAAIVVDTATNDVIYEERADSQRYPASLTKLMTLYMLFKALETKELTLDSKIPISAHAANMAPSKLNLPVGSSIRAEDAILALVVQSANDVAAAVAEKLGGTEAKFARAMTEQAHAIGMSNTNYANASGLPNRKQTTTARDLYVLADRLMNDFPQYYGYFSTPSFKWNGRVYKSHNHMLGRVAGVDGLKTGYIDASGFNIVTSAERDGRRIIAVVMGGTSSMSRDTRCKSLIDQKFAELAKKGPVYAQSRLGAKLAAASALPRTKPALPDAGAQLAAVEESEDGAPVTSDAVVPTGLPAPTAELAQAAVVQEEASPVSELLVSAAHASTPQATKSNVSAPAQADGLANATAALPSQGGRWGIQIGAFVSTETANTRLEEAREAVPELLAKASEQVVQVKIDDTPFYRARFLAFTETQADRVCAALLPHGFKCFKVPQGADSEYQTGGLSSPFPAATTTTR